MPVTKCAMCGRKIVVIGYSLKGPLCKGCEMGIFLPPAPGDDGDD
jgi:hypothetical protein